MFTKFEIWITGCLLIKKKTTTKKKRDGKKETNAMYKFKYLLVHISMDGCSLKV